jgi:hypothetical protein
MATECLTILCSMLAQTDPRAAPKLDTTTWVALVIGAVATAFVMIRAKARKNRDPLERSSFGGPSLAQQRNFERQMSNLLLELTEMSRTMSASLDTRAARLEALLDEADRKIAQLEQMRQGGNVPSTSVPQMTIARTEPEPPEPAHPTDDVESQHEQVYALADQGCSLQEIAQRLNQPDGEIELILSLRPRRAS